jgi:hypothetical protein
MLWTGFNLYGTMMLRGDAADAARQTAALAAQYREVTRQFPQAPASAEDLRKTVEIAQKLRQETHNPQEMMALVSRAIGASPNVIIKQLGWKYGLTEIETNLQSRPVAGESPAQAAGTGAAAAARRESALIEGEIRPFRGDYRSAIITINRFAERLGEDPKVAEVRVVKLPLNVNPTLALSGNTLDNPEQSATATAEFGLLVLLKPAT